MQADETFTVDIPVEDMSLATFPVEELRVSSVWDACKKEELENLGALKVLVCHRVNERILKHKAIRDKVINKGCARPTISKYNYAADTMSRELEFLRSLVLDFIAGREFELHSKRRLKCLRTKKTA